MLLQLGDVGEAEKALRAAVAKFHRLDETWSEADAVSDLADLLRLQGRSSEAEPLLQRQAESFAALGDDRSRAIVLGKLADILQQRGKTAEALRIRREGQLPVFERLGDVRSLLVGRANLAIGLVQRDGPGDRDEARSLLQWALDAAHKMQLPEAKRIQGILDGMA